MHLAKHTSGARRGGHTFVELIFVLVLIGILTLIAASRLGAAIRKERVRAASSVIAGDLERAFTLAARLRRPMRLSCDCAHGVYTISDRDSAAVRVERSLHEDSDLDIAMISFSEAQVDIFPSGVASRPLTVTVSDGSYSRQVTVSTVGRVRQVP